MNIFKTLLYLLCAGVYFIIKLIFNMLSNTNKSPETYM